MTDFANLRIEMCRIGVDPGPYSNETLKQLVMICDRFMSQREAALKELQDLGEEFDRDAEDVNQKAIQLWNDAVEACRVTAWVEVQSMERDDSNGLPSPARSVVRAINRLHRGGDNRQRIVTNLEASDFPVLGEAKT